MEHCVWNSDRQDEPNSVDDDTHTSGNVYYSNGIDTDGPVYADIARSPVAPESIDDNDHDSSRNIYQDDNTVIYSQLQNQDLYANVRRWRLLYNIRSAC